MLKASDLKVVFTVWKKCSDTDTTLFHPLTGCPCVMIGHVPLVNYACQLIAMFGQF